MSYITDQEIQKLTRAARLPAEVGVRIKELLEAEEAVFTDTEDGLVPASGGGSTSFLRADGSWATPASSTFSGASVYKASTNTLNLAATLISHDTEVFDTDGYWSAVNPSRLIAPTDGYYLITAAISFSSASTAGSRRIDIRKNAGGVFASGTGLGAVNVRAADNGATLIQLTRTVSLTAGEYVEMWVTQTSGGSLSALGAEGTPFQISRLGT